jgi:hypothetical protein
MSERLVRSSIFSWQNFAMLAAGLVIVGLVVSLMTKNSHYLARFGTLVAAIGAVLVVLQIRFDIAVEREFQDLLRRLDYEDSSISSPVLDEVAGRIRQQSKLKAHEEVKAARTSAAIIVATITAAGELLHGWGDVLMHYLERLIF